jgi:hypothetical protein
VRVVPDAIRQLTVSLLGIVVAAIESRERRTVLKVAQPCFTYVKVFALLAHGLQVLACVVLRPVY